VRLWLVLTLVVCAVMAYLLYSRIMVGLEERKLILQGDKVEAIVDEIEGQNRPGIKVARSTSPHVKMHFKTKEGVEQTVEGNLVRMLQGDVIVGKPLAIRVDPKDALLWTDRMEPRPWLANLSMPLLFLPVVVVTVLVMILKRHGVLRIWKTGEPAEATVVSLEHSGLAPRSRLLRYALTEREDRRVFTMLYPVRAGLPQKGDELQLLVIANNPSRAIVAAFYA